jgi:hypothetical protein|tara:strand:+ start:3288 stop:3416 length:129 start_codon:yes stop_codon:yes gene_type:complete
MLELVIGIGVCFLLYLLGLGLYADPVARALVSNQYISGEEDE